MSAPPVHIHYLRPPGRQEVFHQYLLLDRDDVKVTFAPDQNFEEPVRVEGEVVLETGSDAVWFTFPGRWHDIGRFHTADGSFRGVYANILTPPVLESRGMWRTTDLFLDIWIPAGADPDGPGAPDTVTVLDEEQFGEAVERGWIDEATAEAARAEVEAIVSAAEAGRWPPPVVREWTRERARRVWEG